VILLTAQRLPIDEINELGSYLDLNEEVKNSFLAAC
jgi:hypothetical protein